jgi:hypothetical protein
VRASSCSRLPSVFSCAGFAFTSSGIAHTDFTGVEIASASPLRSMMRPRVAGTSSTRA